MKGRSKTKDVTVWHLPAPTGRRSGNIEKAVPLRLPLVEYWAVWEESLLSDGYIRSVTFEERTVSQIYRMSRKQIIRTLCPDYLQRLEKLFGSYSFQLSTLIVLQFILVDYSYNMITWVPIRRC